MKINPKAPPPLTEREALAWLELLHIMANKRWAPVARILGITVQTMSRWKNQPPTEWWRREQFYAVYMIFLDDIRHQMAQIKGWRKTRLINIRDEGEERFELLPHVSFIHGHDRNDHAAGKFLRAREILIEQCKPGKKVYYSDTLEPLIREEKISPRTLARAAESLEIHKGRTGSGPAWWRMPTEENPPLVERMRRNRQAVDEPDDAP